MVSYLHITIAKVQCQNSDYDENEKQHLKDMQDGKLDYDNLSVTFKGKRYDRDSFDEGNENLPWEKRAYAAGRSRKKIVKGSYILVS